MRKLFTLGSAMLLGLSASAQLTIDENNFTVAPDTTIRYTNIVGGPAIAMPAMGDGQNWDYSNHPLGDTFSFTYLTPIANPFGDAEMMRDDQPVFFGDEEIATRYYYALNSSGFYITGIEFDSTYIDLVAPGSGMYVIIPEQVVNTSNYFMPRLPLTYSASAPNQGGEFKTIVNFRIHAPVLGFDQDTGHFVRTEIDSHMVVGQGWLTPPGYTDSFNVIMVRERYMAYDTMYVDSQKVNDAIVQQFGMENGQTADFTYYSFYAAGNGSELMRLRIDNDANPNQVIGSYVLVGANRVVAGIGQRNTVAVAAYPNPTSGQFNLRFNKTDAQAWNMTITNTLGQMVKSQRVVGTGFIQENVDLGAAANGLYFYTIQDANGAVVATGRVQVVR